VPNTTDRGRSALPSANCRIETAIADRTAAPIDASHAVRRFDTRSGRLIAYVAKQTITTNASAQPKRADAVKSYPCAAACTLLRPSTTDAMPT
jgi:hypothetical protein